MQRWQWGLVALAVAGVAAVVLFALRDGTPHGTRNASRPPPAAVPAPPAAPAAAGASATSGANASADLGFRPNKDGFSFENYGNEGGIANLTDVELRRMFGDAACANLAKGRCKLTPAAKEWMQEVNDSMDGGHCEGLAVLSMLFFTKRAAPSDFGAPSVAALHLEGNPKLQREIAYWYALQEVDPTASSEVADQTPNQVVDRLALAFGAGKPAELFELGIYQPEFQNGHAITPYRIVDRGRGRVAIAVYDSVFPGEERFVEVDRANNTWRYQASDDPAEKDALYEGDAATKTLLLSPLAARLQMHDCPFCGDADEAPAADGRPPRRLQILSRGQAHVTVTDEAGHVTGRQGAALVNTIAGAVIVKLRGRNLRSDDREPMYAVPVGGAYQITVDTSSLASDDHSAVTVVGPGLTFGVAELILPPNQRDSLSVSKDRHTFGYKTAQAHSPELTLGVTTPGADYEFTLRSIGSAGGQTVVLHIDQQQRVLRLQIQSVGGGASQFALDIERIDDEDSELFSHAAIGLGAADVAVLRYGAWQGNGKAVALQIDVGGVGTQTRQVELTDEE